MNLRRMRKALPLYLSSEFRAVRRIIRHPEPSRTAAQIECDAVFTARLQRNASALLLRFWRDHFEWQDLLRHYPEIGGHMLDFGCGSGHSDIFLARHGRRVHGVDLSPMGIRIAAFCRSREARPIRDRLSFEQRDISSPNDTGMLFDSAWASHVFEHIADPRPVLEGLRRYLRPDAPLLVSVPYRHAYEDPGHVHHFYSPADLRNLLSDHIRVERIDLNTHNQVLRALCRYPG